MGLIQDFIKKNFITPATEPLQKELIDKNSQIEKLLENVNVFDLPSSYMNVAITNRAKPQAVIDWQVLRHFSVNYDIARACINARKRQVSRLEWTIAPIDNDEESEKYLDQINAVKTFFKSPMGKYTRLRNLTDKIVEDLLVLDAVAIYKDKEGKQLKRLIPIDGATIRLRVDQSGMLPDPPEVAYEQIIKSQIVASMTKDDLIYEMMNARTNSAYGLAPLESLIIDVNSALRSQMYNLSYLEEGNVPEGFLFMPETWNNEQIKTYQVYFDSLVAGNLKQINRLKLMPGGKGTGFTATKTINDMRFKEFELWLAVKTCAIFEIQPQEIGLTMDINKATGQVQEDIAVRRSIFPMSIFLKEIFDTLIQEDLGFPELEFVWSGMDNKDEIRDAEKTAKLLPYGLIGVDEWRKENDLPPLGLDNYIMTPSGPVKVQDFIDGVNPYAPVPVLAPMVDTTVSGTEEAVKVSNFVMTKEGPVHVDDFIKGENSYQVVPNLPVMKLKDEEKVLSEEVEDVDKTNKMLLLIDIKKWQKKALTDIKRGKKVRKFESSIIEDGLKKTLTVDLSKVKTKEEVRDVFKSTIEKVESDIKKVSRDVEFEPKFIDLSSSPKFKSLISVFNRGFQRQLNDFLKTNWQPEYTDIFKSDNDADMGKSEVNNAQWSKLRQLVKKKLVKINEYVDEELIKGYYRWSANIGGQSGLNKLGITGTFNLKNEKIIDFFNKRVDLLIDSVDNTTADWISNRIAEGKSLNLSTPEIADMIKQRVPETFSGRSEMIVRTETNNAVSFTELKTATKNGATYKRWDTGGDERVCEDCQSNEDEGLIKLDGSFSTGDERTPAHPSCRCVLDYEYNEVEENWFGD